MNRMTPTYKCAGGCGRTVSHKDATCLECKMNQEKLDSVCSQPVDPGATHIIVTHKEGDVDVEDLYRANGMLCASRQKDVVRFGTDISTAQNRPFLNATLASAFLVVMAEVDLKAQEQMLPIHQVIDQYVQLQKEPKAMIERRDIAQEHSGLVLPSVMRH